MVVVCERGSNARIEKGYNVSLGGAAGMVLFNTAVTDLETDNHFLSAIHVNDPGLTIATFISGHTGVMATWAAGVASSAQGDVMASFSSRGPLGDWIKPDVTAPGVQILAGESPHHLFSPADGLGPAGEYYQAIAGTSMSSPHAAGVALLIKAAHPSWTPGQIKSAMMTSSLQDVVKEDGSTPADPFDMGAGSIRANRAVNPTVTLDVPAWAFYAADGDQFARLGINIASVNATNMPGVITTTRTVENVTNRTQVLRFHTDAPNNSSITIEPSKLVLAPNQSKSFEITIDGSKLADGQYFGQITINPVAHGYNNAVLPVAFNKHPGEVTLENSCDTPSAIVAQDLTIAKGDTANCEVTVTNYNASTAHVQVKVKGPNNKHLKINNWSEGNQQGNGFIWNGALSPALAPEVLGLATGDDSYYGGVCADYGPLAAFSDESLDNEAVLPFSFGGEVYDTLMFDSNGYLVVGGGSSSDHSYSPTGLFPGASAPNNVLAPYWTDLNPDDGGEICAGYYWGDIAQTFLILGVEYLGVPVFGTGETRSFEVWIVSDGANQEGIWFEYDGSDMGAGDPDATLQVGAENRDGSSAAVLGTDIVPSSIGYEVVMGTPTAGGSKTLTYDAFGRKTGRYLATASMTSDVTQGTDQQRVRIHVVKLH